MAHEDLLKNSISANTPESTIGFIDQVRMMVRALWGARVRTQLILLAASLLAIILVTAYAQVLVNEWNVPFYDAIARRDLAGFYKQLRVFALIAGALLLLNVAQTWFNQITALKMREGLARDLVDQWLHPKRALRLSSTGILGVNPDQRLHEDASHLSEITTSLAIGLVQATITLASFVGVLWDLSEGFVFHVSDHSFSIPGYMVWAAVIYALSASLLSALVGRKLVSLNADRYSKEAELRATLMRSNENITAITLLKGETNERVRIDTDITAVLGVMRRLAFALTNLRWVSAGYGWLTVIAPILIAAPVYFSGGMTFGGLMMTVGAFNQVYTALRWYVDNFGTIADWKATLMRVASFRQALLQMDDVVPQQGTIVTDATGDGSLTIGNLDIFAEKGTAPQANGLRLRERDVVIQPGERVMVNGDPGVNRRLFFLALSGWWPWGTGQIGLPPEDETLNLPQAGYLPKGSLREVISFPAAVDAYPQADIETALDKVGLSRLAGMIDTTARWDRTLDKDEQVSLLFATALLRRPRWIIFDDVLEGLEHETQTRLMGALDELRDTTVLYVGRSDVFAGSTAPRVLHLEPLSPQAAV